MSVSGVESAEGLLVDGPPAVGDERARGLGLRWLAGRVLGGVAVLVFVSLVVFVATQALPTDAAQAILGKQATPERLAVLRHQLHLDEPLVKQYLGWLGRVVQVDLGESLTAQKPVTSLLGTPLVNSLFLLVIVGVIAIPLSVLLGIWAAARRDGVFDGAALLGAMFASALPEFVVGLGLVVLFSTGVLTVLPSVALIPPGDTPFDHLDEMVLPVVTLTIAVVPFLFRLVRASMIDVLTSEYVACARLRGVPEALVLRRHAMPNALVPMVQASAMALSYLLGGIVVVEYVFNYPGLGSQLTASITARDLPMVQALVLVFTVGVVLFTLIADALTVLLTPRLRTAAGR